jgi:hypothetical protein
MAQEGLRRRRDPSVNAEIMDGPDKPGHDDQGEMIEFST